MERQLIYLIVLCGLLSGCKQTEVVALANPLNGLYKGDVTTPCNLPLLAALILLTAICERPF
jgi:cytochrome c biogenesis protein CcdA